MHRLLVALGILLAISIGCLGSGGDEGMVTEEPVVAAPETIPLAEEAEPEAEVVKPEVPIPKWMNSEMIDPITTEKIKTSDFLGKPILILNFNIELTSSLKQHQAMQEVENARGGSVVLISLNLDQSLDKRSMAAYVNKYGFDWHFVLPSADTKDALVDVFGLDIINPEKVPVILVCPDVSSKLLEQGVKSADTLQSAIDAC